MKIKTFGPINGNCNICGIFSKLTEDHTPPKGVYKPRQVEIYNLLKGLSRNKPSVRGGVSQNGIKYRTLCADCNNRILGKECDESLKDFTNQISKYLISSILLPRYVDVRVKPQRVIRSLLGHIMAQGVNRQPNDKVQKYLLNFDEALPDEINIYFWPYFSHRVVVARDYGFYDSRASKPVYGWLMKFFPVAFLVTFGDVSDYNLNVDTFSYQKNLLIDDVSDIKFNLGSVPDEFYMEKPSSHGMIMLGEGAISAFGSNNNFSY